MLDENPMHPPPFQGRRLPPGCRRLLSTHVYIISVQPSTQIVKAKVANELAVRVIALASAKLGIAELPVLLHWPRRSRQPWLTVAASGSARAY